MHKTLINGTEYDVNGGKALIGGTSYGISKGRTLVGGTGYDISFGTWTDRFVRLMQNATLVDSVGRSSSSESSLYMSKSVFTEPGAYYFFAFGGIGTTGIGIVKMVYDGSQFTKTDLFLGRADYGWTVTDYGGRNEFYIGYYTGTPRQERINTGFNSAGLFLFQFSGYAEANVDSILSQFAFQRGTCYDNPTADYVYIDAPSTGALLAQSNSYIGLSYPYGTVIFGNSSTNPSLLSLEYNKYYIAATQTNRQKVRGGCILEL